MKQIDTIPVKNVSVFRKDANMFVKNISTFKNVCTNRLLAYIIFFDEKFQIFYVFLKE
jgi:hypothetical protein